MAADIRKYLNPIFGLKPSTANETSTGQDSAEVDMAGYEGIRAFFILGNTTGDATFTCSLRGSTASGGTYAEITGATVTTTTGQGDKGVVVTCHRPLTRYIKARIVRSAANAAHGGIMLDQYGPKFLPITDSTTLYSVVNVYST